MTETAIFSQIATDLNLNSAQIKSVAFFIDEGATIPFLARYRKEATGGLDEDQLRAIRDALEFQRTLRDRKAFILESIRKQDKLSDELENVILSCIDFSTLEDLYLPYKPKRKTKAGTAKEKGLEPLALRMWEQRDLKGDRLSIASAYMDIEKGVSSSEEALAGARDICAEWMNEDADVRSDVRRFYQKNAQITARKISTVEERTVFEDYYDFSAWVNRVKPHQVLALNRAEHEAILIVKIRVEEDRALAIIEENLLRPEDSLFIDDLIDAFEDGYKRLLHPAMERETRAELTDKADQHAIKTFAKNLHSLLLQPPLSDNIVMGIDPAYRTGCKVAVVDQMGNYLEGTTIFPTPPHNKIIESAVIVKALIQKHNVNLIAIGNGTGSRETEQFVAEILRQKPHNPRGQTVEYLIVNEAGASVYSASPQAKEEFPDLEAAQRGNISIARRVQDPLAELVKIDPKSIGVGLYQHDVNQTQLNRQLEDVVESCVNTVGVNLNTASTALLTHVSGLSKKLAENVVHTRNKQGGFSARQQLHDVPGMGPFRFEQSAGFLRIPESENVLDNTAIHPESYEVAIQLLTLLGIKLNDVKALSEEQRNTLKSTQLVGMAKTLQVGLPTIELIVENLLKPGRDPRENLPKPLLRTDILKMEDLRAGQEVQGTVRNVVDFGAFVDIGVKQDGLLHISKMGRGQRVSDPHEWISVGDILSLVVESIDLERGRIALVPAE